MIEHKQNQLYVSQSYQELLDYYDQWATEYDHELVDEYQYIAPQKVAEVLLNLVSKDGKILDAGAGTGLVGQILYQYGYSHIEGMDISTKMLEQARQKNIYHALYEKVMGEPLGLMTDYFDAVISVGVFTYGHAPSSSLDELIRITKSGGYIIFTLRLDFYENSDFPLKLTTLEESGKWNLIEVGNEFSPLSIAKRNGFYRVWVYQVS